METSSTTPSINLLRAKTKKALLLYLEGFREVCYLHSVVLLYRRFQIITTSFSRFFKKKFWVSVIDKRCNFNLFEAFVSRSRKFLIRTGQCFLLNGFIILGRAVLAQKAEPDYWLGKIRQDLERINEETLNDLEGLDGDKPCTVSNLTAFQHSLDHNTSGEEEVQRIKNEHPNDACAMMNDRVKGSLEVTRAFGAGFLKQDRRDTVWPHDPHTRWSYCVTMPSWILLPHSRGSDLVAVHKQIFFSILPF